MKPAIVNFISRLMTDRRGGVSVLGALSIVPLIGIAAISLELGQGYQAKITNQSIADAAALAAANAYSSTRTDAILTATAGETANANGVATSNIMVTRLSNYSPTVSDAVQVVVTKTIPIFLGRVFSSQPSYTVSATAIASLAGNAAPPCIVALASQDIVGFSQLAANMLSAPQCAVQSNSGMTLTAGSRTTAKLATASGTISVSGGSNLTADTIIYGGTSTAWLFGSITGSQTQKANSVADPPATNAGIAAARALLGSAPAPSTPFVAAGNDLMITAYTMPVSVQGVMTTLVDGVWTLPAGVYNFRNLSVNGTKLRIRGPSTVTVGGYLWVGFGGGLTIDDGTVSIKGQSTIGGLSTMTVGAGRHYTGPVNVYGASKLTIGAGDLDVNGLILLSDPGTAVTLGPGDHTLGSDGVTSINLIGGAALAIAAGDFSATGNVVTSGGSTLTFGAAPNHVIDGLVSLWGTTNFGSGTYIIDGLFSNNAGGTMTGSDVSFVLSGAVNATYGTGITLSAPSSTSGTGIPDVLFATSTIWPTLIGGGPQDDFSGAVYSPNAPFMMTGGSVSSGSCFMIIAQSVLLSIGNTAAKACGSMTGASGSVTLIR